MGWGWLGWLAGRFIVIFIFIKDSELCPTGIVQSTLTAVTVPANLKSNCKRERSPSRRRILTKRRKVIRIGIGITMAVRETRAALRELTWPNDLW